MADITTKINDLLGDKANVSYVETNGKTTIAIKPPSLTKGCTGYFLEYIKSSEWNDISIPKDITVELDGWLIDTDDEKVGSDLWCLKWMNDNYTIVDKCVRWRSYKDD